MMYIRFFLRLTLLPFINFCKDVYSLFRYKIRFPTLIVGHQVKITDCEFGQYNSVGFRTIFSTSKLGSYSYVAQDCFILNTNIGKFSCIGPYVKIGLAGHPARDFVSIHPIFYSSDLQIGTSFNATSDFQEFATTSIGNDVWIGAGVIVRAGVTIGDGAIIGAGSVVTKDIPAYSIFAGAPAKLIRMRFAEQEISKLDQLKWWDKNPESLKAHYKAMQHIKNIEVLMTKL